MTTTEEVPADSPSGLLLTALRCHPRKHTDRPDALAAVRKLQERLVEEEHQLVFELRNSGSTWQEIADATGMESRQAAQYRYEKSAGLIDRLDAARGRTPRA